MNIGNSCHTSSIFVPLLWVHLRSVFPQAFSGFAGALGQRVQVPGGQGSRRDIKAVETCWFFQPDFLKKCKKFVTLLSRRLTGICRRCLIASCTVDLQVLEPVHPIEKKRIQQINSKQLSNIFFCVSFGMSVLLDQNERTTISSRFLGCTDERFWGVWMTSELAVKP